MTSLRLDLSCKSILVAAFLLSNAEATSHWPPNSVALPEKETFNLWAPPVAWSAEYDLTSHGGVISYKIDLEAIGDTQVRGKVKYYGASGWVEKEFYDSVSFTTGDAWGKVSLRMRGEPLGSAVMVTIIP